MSNSTTDDFSALDAGLAKVFDECSEADAKRFLADVLAGDERLAARFMAAYGPADVKARGKALRSELAGIRREYARDGFIDWRGSWDFEAEYQEAICGALDPVLERGDADGAFDLLETAIMHFRSVHIDDSNGFVTSTFDLCKRYYAKAFALAPAAEVGNYVGRVCALARKVEASKREGDFDWYLVPELYALPADLLADDGNAARAILELCDERISDLEKLIPGERAEAEANARRYRGAGASGMTDSRFIIKTEAEREIARWACYRVRAMVASGAALDEIERFVAGHDGDCKVLLAFADACERAGEPERAVRVLERALAEKADELGVGGADQLRLRLVALYRSCGMDEREREMLTGLLQQERPPMDAKPLELFRRYREIVPREEWSERRNALFAGMQNRYVLCDCLEEEGLGGEILRIAKESRGFDVSRYESTLMEVDSDFVIGWYRDRVVKEFDLAYNRHGYREASRELAALAAKEGGLEVARAIARDVREKYPRKTALADELEKAGFPKG